MGNIVIRFAELIYKFVALNLIWLLFFLMGLGVFGFMPATVALFSVVRQWIKGEKELELFKMFFSYYKEVFFRSNALWLIFISIFYIIYVNFSFVSFYYRAEVQFYIYMMIAFIAIIVISMFINVFSLIAHFEYKLLQYLKVALGMVFFRPLNSLMQLLWLCVYLIIAINWPTIFMVLGVSCFAFILMALNYQTFLKYTPS